MRRRFRLWVRVEIEAACWLMLIVADCVLQTDVSGLAAAHRL